MMPSSEFESPELSRHDRTHQLYITLDGFKEGAMVYHADPS